MAVESKINSAIQEYFTIPALPKEASFVQLWQDASSQT